MSSKKPNPTSSSGEVIKHHSLKCEKCGNSIDVPIKKADLDSAVGGIFRVVVIHQCTKDQVAMFLFFDKHLTLRQKVISQITVSDVPEDYSIDKTSQIPTKELAMLKYLYKKFHNELNKAIYAVLVGQQLVIFGEKNEVEPSCDALLLFAPHRNIMSEKWSIHKSEADIVGTSPKFKEDYWDSVQIHLLENKITNGFENEFPLQLLKKVIALSDPGKVKETIQNELNRILNYVKEYSSVQNVEEAEAFFTALAIEGIDQNVLDIVLLISAQLNSSIASYYRKNKELLPEEKQLTLPSNVWVIEKNPDKIECLILSLQKDKIHTHEQKLLKRIERIADEKQDNELLWEYLSPMYHYIIYFYSNRIVVFRYPRLVKDGDSFEKSLHLFNNLEPFLVESASIEELNNFFMLVSKELSISLENLTLLSNKEIRQTLPLHTDSLILERHYIQSCACTQDIKLVITKIIELISNEYRTLSPKLVRTSKMNIIKETLVDVITNETNLAEKIDIGFSIGLFTQSTNNRSRIDIFIELFIHPSFFKLGLDINYAFDIAYTSLSTIIYTALEQCKKIPSFVGVK